MTMCPKPGCGGEVSDGRCRRCGFTMPAPNPLAQAEKLRRQGARAAEELGRRAASNGTEEGTGWFRAPDVLTGSEEAPREGAHRRSDESPTQAVRAPAPWPMPNVAPNRHAGRRNVDDEPQPTSVLAETPPTLSINPPKPPEPPATQAGRPGTAPSTGPTTGPGT